MKLKCEHILCIYIYIFVMYALLLLKARIGMAKTAFNRWKELFVRGISRKVEKKIIETVICSIL